MKLVKKLLGIATIIAVVGFITLPMIGCPADSDNGDGDGNGEKKGESGTPSGTFAITMQNDGHGTATANPNPAAQGTEVTITATDNSGYIFDSWQVISGGITLSHNKANPAMFTMPGNAVTIKATFAVIPANTPALSLAPPTFDDVTTTPYMAQPVKDVKITNEGTATANITSITLDEPGKAAFILGDISSITTVVAGEKATFTVQPKTGLLAFGTYEGTVTVTYDSGKKVEATFSFTVIYTANNLATLNSWLSNSSQIANTAANPYKIKLTVSSIGTGSGSLGYYLIQNKSKYVSIDLSDSTITSIGDNAFAICTSLSSIIINSSSIGSNAFQGCTNLANVTLGNSVNSIGNNAFGNCHSLTNITIPNSVTSIGNNAFIICISLSAINVNAGNSEYLSQDGILYNKAKTTLIKYPAGKTSNTFTIPNNVTNIASGAFAFCTSLTNVTIPDSVTSIGNYAFDTCTSLTSVTFATGSNISNANFGDEVFPEESSGDGGDTLKSAYSTGKAGTYTRAVNGSTWEKQP